MTNTVGESATEKEVETLRVGEGVSDEKMLGMRGEGVGEGASLVNQTLSTALNVLFRMLVKESGLRH